MREMNERVLVRRRWLEVKLRKGVSLGTRYKQGATRLERTPELVRVVRGVRSPAWPFFLFLQIATAATAATLFVHGMLWKGEVS